MTIEIKNRFTGNVIFSGEFATVALCLAAAISSGADLRSADLRSANLGGADLRSANLGGANLRSADLYGANLRSADLYGANLYGANLRSADLYGANLGGANLRSADLYGANLGGADLRSADLGGANLRSADLYGAKGTSVAYTNDLELMLLQTGKVRALKVVTLALKSPMQAREAITYKIGERVEVLDANTDPLQGCGKGIHVCSPKFFVTNAKSQGWTHDNCVVLIVEFSRKDIACIPYSGEGKFRLFRCTPVSRVSPEQLKAWLNQEPEASEEAK